MYELGFSVGDVRLHPIYSLIGVGDDSMGFARVAESSIRSFKGKGENEKLTPFEKILSSTIGGALATWNQPIEVVRVEMQSMAKGAERGEKKTILNTLSYIYKENGIKGLYRGVTPRIGLGIWQTVCMVSFADYVKAWYAFFTPVGCS